MTEAHGHSERHLREASAVTTFGSQHQIEIQLGHVCNNRCVFCVSGQLTDQGLARPVPAEPILEALEQARAQGVRKVTFLGGEPTVQRSFLPALRRAVELGFDDIVLFTNGVKARKREFVEEIVALGRFTWRFSVQGGNEEAHDRVVGRRGAFARIVLGMEHLRDLGQDITVNMCVNTHSYESLPDFPPLMAAHGVRQLHIDMVRPSDAGVRTDAYLRSIMPPYEAMAPFIARMLEGFDALDPDYDVNIGNYPYCLLPEWAHKIHHDGELTFTIAADGQSQLSKPWNKYEQKRSDKHHPPACDACVFKPQCNGVFDKYAQFYGTDALRPVTLERLRAMDTRQHFFVLLVDDALQPLLAAPPPEGWRAAQVHRNTRDRRVEVRYADARGAAVTLLLAPPEGVGARVEAPEPVLVTNRYRVALLADRGAEATAVGDLAAWALARLLAADGVTEEARLEIGALVARLMDPDRLGRARTRLVRLAQRVQRQRRFGAWRYERARPLDDGLGTVLEVAGPGGARVDLVLSVQSDPERPPVAVSYRLGPRTDEASAREVLTDLMGVLRG